MASRTRLTVALALSFAVAFGVTLVFAATFGANAAPTALPTESACDVPGERIHEGHFDFGPVVTNGTLTSKIKDDRPNPPAWIAPDAITFVLGTEAQAVVPNSSAYNFLGTTGAPVWTIGQTQKDDVPWLGWNTQHPTALAQIDGPTTWTLSQVDGPGELFVYQTGSFGAVQPVFGSTGTWPKSTTIPRDVHVHANWSFTQPGVYTVHTTHRAILKAGDTQDSASALTFVVGSCEDPTTRPADPLTADQLLADEQLAESNQGVLTTPATATAHDTITLSGLNAHAGTWVMPVFYSDPTQTRWTQVGGNGTLRVQIPDLPAGPHKVAAYAPGGALLGWSPMTITAKPVATPAPTASPTTTPGSPANPNTPQLSQPSATTSATGTTQPTSAAAPKADPTSTTGTSAGSADPTCQPSTNGNGTGSTGGTDGNDGGGNSGSGSNPGAPGASAEVVSEGHFDFGALLDGSQLRARVKDDRTQPPSWVDPSTLTFAVGSKGEETVPSSAQYSFLGSPGSKVWIIPQAQIADVPWLGWNTQHDTVRAQVDGAMKFTLNSVTGPGKLAVYLNDSFGGVGEKKFGTVGGFPKSFAVPVNVHAHGNWAFTKAGTYRVTMSQSATLKSGKRVSATGTLQFKIGSSANPRALASTSSLAQGAAAPGAQTAPVAAPAAKTCTLGPTGAPPVAGKVSLGVLLVLLGALTVAVSIALDRRPARRNR